MNARRAGGMGFFDLLNTSIFGTALDPIGSFYDIIPDPIGAVSNAVPDPIAMYSLQNDPLLQMQQLTGMTMEAQEAAAAARAAAEATATAAPAMPAGTFTQVQAALENLMSLPQAAATAASEGVTRATNVLAWGNPTIQFRMFPGWLK